MIPISYNLRSLAVRKTTTVATALGIGLVVFVLASSLMLSAGIRKTMSASGSRSNGLVLRHGSDAELASNIDGPNVNLILAAPGIKKNAEGQPLGTGEVVVVAAMAKVGDPDKFSNLQIRGVSDNVMQVRPEVRIIEGRPAKPGTNEVVIGKKIADRFIGVSLGSSFELKKNRPVKVVGIFDAGGSAFDSEVWADIDLVRNAYGREGLVSSVVVQLESPAKFDAFRAAVENDKRLGLEALRENEYYEKVSEGTSIFITAMGVVIAVLFSIGAMIGAMITMYAAVAQRSREIGTLQALGFSRWSILTSFIVEAVLLALIGAGLGAVASLGMSFVSFSMMNFATFQEIVFTFDPTPPVLVSSIVAGAMMGVVGGFFPALKAARTNPVNAMRA